MNKVYGILALLFMFCLVSAQDGTLRVDTKESKAKQVLDQAKRAISQKVELSNIKSLTLNSEKAIQSTFNGRKIQGTLKTETSFILPDKIRQKTLGNYTTNQENSLAILNDGKFSSRIEIFVDGRLQQDFGSVVDKKTQIFDLRRNAFLSFFPLLLDASWYAPLEFSYSGVAESKDGKAEVIEAISRGKTKYRLFFGINSHLLLLMTESWVNTEGKEFENKYFFSNYKEKDGLLVATNISIERNGEVVEEREIKDLKINPSFKPDFFEIK